MGHSLTTYALMPGGYAMPITSGPSPAGAFNTEDQAAFVENLARVLAERDVIKLVATEAGSVATITVKFLKTEHFPDMQDYILDALVTASTSEKSFKKVYHVSTIDNVNLVARMFQNGIDGRRRAAELLLAAVVPDLEAWFNTTTVVAADANVGAIFVPRPFNPGAFEIAQFLREKYARPSTFWKDGISVHTVRPSPHVIVVELRWSNSETVPPFCTVDIYSEGNGIRAMIRERDGLLTSRVGVREALQEYIRQIASPATDAALPKN